MSFVLCQKTSKSWQLQVDGTLIEPKCEVSHGNFRDWPHVFYIYKQVNKFCDCINISIFHFGYFLGTYPKNYFFISKIANHRKSFIHAALPLFCTFPKFFPKSKIDRQILPQIFSNFPKWIFPISPHFGCKIFDSQQGMCRKSWCWHQKRASSQGSSWGNIFCCNVSPQGEFRQLYKFNAL